MRRRWGVKRFLDRCDLVHQSLHKPALTTDIIVGFPGETEEDFQASCEVARKAGFSKIHVFPFSARKDTPAAEMDGQVSKQEKSDRVARLSEVGDSIRRDYFDSLIGERLQMMVESTSDGRHRGTSCRYAPVEISSEQLGHGTLVDVHVQQQADDILVAESV
jgi:threonylcarbamoyladenosine tRNA methylthiotransferase MtaB